LSRSSRAARDRVKASARRSLCPRARRWPHASPRRQHDRQHARPPKWRRAVSEGGEGVVGRDPSDDHGLLKGSFRLRDDIAAPLVHEVHVTARSQDRACCRAHPVHAEGADVAETFKYTTSLSPYGWARCGAYPRHFRGEATLERLASSGIGLHRVSGTDRSSSLGQTYQPEHVFALRQAVNSTPQRAAVSDLRSLATDLGADLSRMHGVVPYTAGVHSVSPLALRSHPGSHPASRLARRRWHEQLADREALHVLAHAGSWRQELRR
jgi:hypothetical protein